MESTNFFSTIAALQITGDLQLTIRQGAENKFIVSILLNNEQCGDDARKIIPPLILNGSAEELNNGFFNSITTPLQNTSQLLINMETFLKGQEEAKQQSAMEKEKTDRERKDKEGKDKKYKEAMQKVDELEKESKYREAWMKVPDPSVYPDQAEAIRKRKASLSIKFAPDLFGADTKPIAEPQQEETSHADEETEDVDENEEEDNEESN